MQPDAIIASSGFIDPQLTSIQDDPAAPDTNWIGASLPFSIRIGFSSPSGTIVGTQTFQVLVRKRVSGPTPDVNVSLYEAGVLVRMLLAQPVFDENGQIITATFDASEVTNPANVEILIEGAYGAPSITNVGTIAGTAQPGQVLTLSGLEYTGSSVNLALQWYRDTSGTGDLTGETSTSYSVAPTDDGHDIGVRISLSNDIGTVTDFPPERSVTYAAPTLVGTLAAQAFNVSTGSQFYNASVGFAGGGITYTLTTSITGVSIAAATGLVTHDTNATGPLSAVTVTIRATNSGGFVEQSYALDVAGNYIAPAHLNTRQSGNNSLVLAHDMLRPATAIGDLVLVVYGVSSAASPVIPCTVTSTADVAGGPNGETVTKEQDTFDNTIAGTTGTCETLFSYIATSTLAQAADVRCKIAANPDAMMASIMVFQDGTFEPSAPIAEKATAFSATNVAAVVSAGLTVAEPGSRVVVAGISRTTAVDPAQCPAGWTYAEAPLDIGIIGSFVAIRNAVTTVASEVIAAQTFPFLGAATTSWTALTFAVAPGPGDPPTLAAISNRVYTEDTGAQTFDVSALATGPGIVYDMAPRVIINRIVDLGSGRYDAFIRGAGYPTPTFSRMWRVNGVDITTDEIFDTLTHTQTGPLVCRATADSPPQTHTLDSASVTLGNPFSAYYSASGVAPVCVADFHAGLYGVDTGSGLVTTTRAALINNFSAIVTSGGINGLRINDGDTPDILLSAFAWNPAAGSAIARWRVTDAVSTDRIFSIDNGTNQIALYLKSSLRWYFNVTGGCDIDSTVAHVDDTLERACVRWGANNFAMSVNGTAIKTDVSGTVPSGMIRCNLGHNTTTTGQPGGRLERIVIFGVALSNSDVVAGAV